MTTDNTEAALAGETEVPVIPQPENTEDTAPDPTVQLDETQDDLDDSDPFEEFKKVFEETQAAKIRQEEGAKARLEFEQQQELARQYQAAQAAKYQLQNSFSTAARTTVDKLSAMEAYDADGNRIRFDDKMVQEIIEPWQKHNATVQQAATTGVYSSLGEAAMAALPTDEARAKFAKDANGKPLVEYMRIFSELMAPHTEAHKSTVADLDVKVKAAELKGYTKGQKAKPGTPQIGNDRGPGTPKAAPITSLYDAAMAAYKGEISDAKFLEYKKQFSNN